MLPVPEPRRFQRNALGLGGTLLGVETQSPVGSSGQWPEVNPSTHSRPLHSRRPIVVPLDGSASAEHALPYALAIARRTGAVVWIVHVQSRTHSITPWRQYNERLFSRLREQKHQYLQSLLDRIRRVADVDVVTIVIESNATATSLCKIAVKAAIVVMATRRQGPVGRLLHWSVTDEVMRLLPCPLLLIRGQKWTVDLSNDPMPQRILFPLNGTPCEEAVFDAVASLGWFNQAHCTLAYFQGGAPLNRCEQAELRYYLLGAARRVKELLPQAHTAVETKKANMAIALLPFAERRSVDLIAFVDRSSGGFLGLVNRSVATAVRWSSTKPILVCR